MEVRVNLCKMNIRLYHEGFIRGSSVVGDNVYLLKVLKRILMRGRMALCAMSSQCCVGRGCSLALALALGRGCSPVLAAKRLHRAVSVGRSPDRSVAKLVRLLPLLSIPHHLKMMT